MELRQYTFTEKIRINNNDTFERICYNNVILGKELLLQSLKILIEGNTLRIPQDDMKTSYIKGLPSVEDIRTGIVRLNEWECHL